MLYKKRRRYKYNLQSAVEIQVHVKVDKETTIGPLTIRPDGYLLIQPGYAWDGASSCPDVKSILYPSLIHDALYQLMREGILDIDVDRIIADRLLRDLCIEKGMWKPAAMLVYYAVRLCAEKAARNDTLSA